MRTMFVTIFLIVIFATTGFASASEEKRSMTPAASIASGYAAWVSSVPDGGYINAKVDVGSMRQIGDEFEVKMQWPSTPHSSASTETERVICLEGEMLYYTIKVERHDPKPGEKAVETFDPAVERKKAIESSLRPIKYGPNPRSLVCWAAARKCENKSMSWPPPPNKTPLEYSERATRMRAEYASQFLPKCRLTSVTKSRK